jgi:hypothetical protein
MLRISFWLIEISGSFNAEYREFYYWVRRTTGFTYSKTNKLSGFQSASEIYRLIDRHGRRNSADICG